MLKTRNLILSGLFAAITALLAQVSILLPFSPVPITGQVFGVFLAGGILGGYWGPLSMLVYLLLGAAGLPVFSNAQGGLHIILGPTGGYLLGFVVGSYFLGKLAEKRNSYPITVSGMLICLAFIYSLGAFQLALLAGLNLKQTLLLGVLPFLPLDVIKLFAAAGLTLAVKRKLLRAGLSAGS